MTAMAATLGLVAGLLHVGFWWMEAVWWRRPSVWKQFGVRTQTDADAVSFNMLNQGYYNLFLGIGAIVGSVLVVQDASGQTVLLGFCCLFMVGAAVVLVSARRELWRAALIQGLIPALVLATLAFI